MMKTLETLSENISEVPILHKLQTKETTSCKHSHSDAAKNHSQRYLNLKSPSKGLLKYHSHRFFSSKSIKD